MEKLIKNFRDLKCGDIVLTPFPMTGEDMIGVVSTIIPTYKYPVSNSDGSDRRRSMRDKDGNISFITSEEEGGQPDEMMDALDIAFEIGGSLYITEVDDIIDFNIRTITEEHPKYNKKLYEEGKILGGFFDAMTKAEENGEQNLGESMMKVLGDMFTGMNGDVK